MMAHGGGDSEVDCDGDDDGDSDVGISVWGPKDHFFLFLFFVTLCDWFVRRSAISPRRM